ncbi:MULTISPECIES: TetR/AcrR family transcriptional regulator [Pseudomonadaceae]|uniref:TetR/AcrR family transcriptional regulator n=1 Tax=Ectopseudomonas toyotomiensis TaxID=554344 RepID=A0AA42LIP1_9GAMM|nr:MULTISPECIES: TetR/AcrR family transcriptional regulator [Pseudomonas]MBG0840691.1 helix-turn-helix transcriptional regulator [Pseudomonas toyotomiensis]MDH0702379.1 TetR/AcrR family transcriptional regulator [Pseudomonas toyotomiensis]MDP9940821.1 AcrR family transcriptional regulator [Pseudomonas sp. 3400]MDR7011614.1 AcrR family transcriptional regulator [Pseudomonas alcaliphila]
MSWPAQKDRRRDKRRREMLWAASDVFTALDFNQANMQAIADSAGVTKATLYAHFGDKEQLYRAVIDYWLEELPEPKLPCQARGGLRACLERVARELLQQSEQPASHALTHIALRSNRIPQKRWRQRYLPYQNYLEKALSQSARCSDHGQAATQFLLLAVGSIDCSNLMAVSEPRLAAAVELFVQAYA